MNARADWLDRRIDYLRGTRLLIAARGAVCFAFEVGLEELRYGKADRDGEARCALVAAMTKYCALTPPQRAELIGLGTDEMARLQALHEHRLHADRRYQSRWLDVSFAIQALRPFREKRHSRGAGLKRPRAKTPTGGL